MFENGVFGASGIKPNAATKEVVGIEKTQDDVSIGDARIFTAATVTCRAGV